MTTPENNLEQRWLHSPDSEVYITPLDPYNDRVLQFMALEHLKYPVELRSLHSKELPPLFDHPDDLVEVWEKDHYPIWVRPVVLEQRFDKYIEAPDVPGDRKWSNIEELNDLMGDHPMKLVSAVDNTDVGLLLSEMERYKAGRNSFVRDHGNNLLSEALFASCFMTAIDRYIELKEAGRPDDPYSRYTNPSFYDIILYHQFENAGYSPATPEQLGALMVDYYRFAEELKPEMKEFKKFTV